MTIETKYDIGQEVWVVSKRNHIKPCPACTEGKITGNDGVQYCCPNCCGSSMQTFNTFSPIPLTVNSIHTSHGRNDTDISYSFDSGFWSRNEQHTYPTEAEAQAECDRRNGGKK